ncbi:MAG: hypothetical protein HC923_06555 [Myxococcales bacterium]|nr:hypothetical protein [Myxococcales bacterium]
MVVGLIVLAASVANPTYDPAIDGVLRPRAGASVAFGVQRLQDEFGLVLSLVTPHVFDERIALRIEGGVGWYPDFRALPDDADDQEFAAWSLYGHVRALLQASTRFALASGRIYAAVGPSFLVLDEQVSSTRVAPGVFGVVGAELFAGDDYRAYPLSFFLEIGGAAHDASADVQNRVGRPQTTGTTIDRPIGTGLALAGGLRLYVW